MAVGGQAVTVVVGELLAIGEHARPFHQITRYAVVGEGHAVQQVLVPPDAHGGHQPVVVKGGMA